MGKKKTLRQKLAEFMSGYKETDYPSVRSEDVAAAMQRSASPTPAALPGLPTPTGIGRTVQAVQPYPEPGALAPQGPNRTLDYWLQAAGALPEYLKNRSRWLDALMTGVMPALGSAITSVPTEGITPERLASTHQDFQGMEAVAARPGIRQQVADTWRGVEAAKAAGTQDVNNALRTGLPGYVAPENQREMLGLIQAKAGRDASVEGLRSNLYAGSPPIYGGSEVVPAPNPNDLGGDPTRVHVGTEGRATPEQIRSYQNMVAAAQAPRLAAEAAADREYEARKAAAAAKAAALRTRTDRPYSKLPFEHEGRSKADAQSQAVFDAARMTDSEWKETYGQVDPKLFKPGGQFYLRVNPKRISEGQEGGVGPKSEKLATTGQYYDSDFWRNRGRQVSGQADLDEVEPVVSHVLKGMSSKQLSPEGEAIKGELTGKLRGIRRMKSKARPRAYAGLLQKWLDEVGTSGLEAYVNEPMAVGTAWEQNMVPLGNGAYAVRQPDGKFQVMTTHTSGQSQESGISMEKAIDLARKDLKAKAAVAASKTGAAAEEPSDEAVAKRAKEMIKFYNDLQIQRAASTDLGEPVVPAPPKVPEVNAPGAPPVGVPGQTLPDTASVPPPAAQAAMPPASPASGQPGPLGTAIGMATRALPALAYAATMPGPREAREMYENAEPAVRRLEQLAAAGDERAAQILANYKAQKAAGVQGANKVLTDFLLMRDGPQTIQQAGPAQLAPLPPGYYYDNGAQ